MNNRQQTIPHKGKPSGPVQKSNLKKSVVDVKTPRRDANKTTYPDKRPPRKTERRRGNICPRHLKENPQEPAGDIVKNAELPGECKAFQGVSTPSENKDVKEPPIKTTPSGFSKSKEKTQKIAGDLEKNSEEQNEGKQPQEISSLDQSLEGKEPSVQKRRSNIRQSIGKKKKTAGKLEKNSDQHGKGKQLQEVAPLDQSKDGKELPVETVGFTPDQLKENAQKLAGDLEKDPEQHGKGKQMQDVTPLDQSNDSKESPLESVCFTPDQLKENAQESAGDLAKNLEQAAAGKALQDVNISRRSKDYNRPSCNLMIETGPETENVNTIGVRNQEHLPDQSDSQPEGQTDAPSAASAAAASGAAAAGTISQAIPITVMLPNNEPLTISFAPDRTVRELEERIKSFDEMPNGTCIFIYSGRTLDPSKTLEDYKVQKSDTIYLHERPETLPATSPDAKEAGSGVLTAGLQTVSVVLPDRSRIVVNAEPGMTVGDLNRKLAQQQGVPPSSQCLIHSGRQMQDHRLLKEYQVPEDSVIFVHRPQSSSVIQSKGDATSMLPVEAVNNKTGNSLCLPINPRSTKSMQSVTAPCQSKDSKELPLETVCLTTDQLKEHDQEHVRTSRTASLNVKEAGPEILNARFKTVSVVLPDRSRVVVNVEPGMTVGDLNRKLAQQQGVPPSSQCLIHSGRQMEDHRLLKEYQIPADSVIVVHRPQSSSVVQRKGDATGMLPVEAKINETGNRLRLPINTRSPNSMQELSKQIEAATRIPAKEQEFMYKGKVLGEGENLLLKKEFLQEPVVTVKRRVLDEIQFFLRNLQGQSRVIKLSSNSTVLQLKEKVHELEGVAVRDQLLTCQGKPLQDGYTLRQSRVVNNSTVQLAMLVDGGSTTWINE
ncbi:hypothetical protein AAHC03_010307 [Spirometra sp. Aus1]